MKGLSAKCQKLEFPGIVLLKKNTWTTSTSPWTALGWPVHGSTVDSTVANDRGSPVLGLAAALGSAACREGGDGKGATRRDRGTTHRSSDDGEEVAHLR
jgi:hypothetical protein